MSKIFMMLGRIFVAALTFLSLETTALSMDVGMLTKSQGGVVFSSDKDSGKPAVAFTKVRVGDKLKLSQDAHLQLVYFDGGRQETWQGAGQLEVGATESKSSTLKPEVKQLPLMLVKQLVRTPSPDIKSRTGMVLVRAMATPEKIKSLEDNYAAMRKDISADDFTPELYLLSGLFELKQLQKIREVLADIAAKHPNNDDAKAVVEHYSRLCDLAESKHL